jgi:hypothetical protein
MAARTQAEDRKWAVYGLYDPREPDHIRYVGITFRGVNRRCNDHVHTARKGGKTYRDAWVRTLLREDILPDYVVLEEGNGCGWKDREGYWILYFRECGNRMTNLTDGGDGAVGAVHSPELRERRSAILRELWKQEQYRERQAAAQKAKKVSDETRKRISESHKHRQPATQITREKIAKAGRGRKHSEETRARMREAQKRITPETREKLRKAATGRTHNQGTRAKLSLLAKQRWQDPEKCQEMRDRLRECARTRAYDPAVGAKISAALTGLKRSAEIRARMSTAARARWEAWRQKRSAAAGEPHDDRAGESHEYP